MSSIATFQYLLTSVLVFGSISAQLCPYGFFTCSYTRFHGFDMKMDCDYPGFCQKTLYCTRAPLKAKLGCGCANLSAPENGTVVTQGTSFGATADYFCNKGFRLVGMTTTNCLATGAWNNDAPACIPVGKLRCGRAVCAAVVCYANLFSENDDASKLASKFHWYVVYGGASVLALVVLVLSVYCYCRKRCFYEKCAAAGKQQSSTEDDYDTISLENRVTLKKEPKHVGGYQVSDQLDKTQRRHDKTECTYLHAIDENSHIDTIVESEC